MGVGVKVDPVIPSNAGVDPSNQPPGILAIEDEDDDAGGRLIQTDQRGLLAEIKRLRGELRNRSGTLRKTGSELEAASKRLSELEAAQEQARKDAEDAKAWREYREAEAKRIGDANAKRLEALTDEQRAAFEGITDQTVIARMLSLIPAPASDAPAQAPASAQPLPKGTPAVRAHAVGSTLTAEEQAFKDARPLLANATDDQVRNIIKAATPRK